MSQPITPSLERKVLLALEIIDPVSRTRVSDSVRVSADGLARRPILNLSRCFVWLEEGDAWPTAIHVHMDGLPYAIPPSLKPERRTAGKPPELARIVLSPTERYPFPSGVLAISGVLKASREPDSPPINEAILQLQWRHDDSEPWNGGARTSPEADGRFCVFARSAGNTHRPDGLVIVRILVSRKDHPDRSTGNDYPFMKAPPTGCIRDRQAHPQPVTLAWNDLQV